MATIMRLIWFCCDWSCLFQYRY